jgi:hypothetical protein
MSTYTTQQDATRAAERTINEATERANDFNSQLVESSRRAGEAYLTTYERGLKSFADLHEQVGRATPFEFVSATTKAQADLVRTVAEAWGAAGRELARTR